MRAVRVSAPESDREDYEAIVVAQRDSFMLKG